MQAGLAPPMKDQKKNNSNYTQDFALDGPAGRQGLISNISLHGIYSFVTVLSKVGRDLSYQLWLKVGIPTQTYLTVRKLPKMKSFIFKMLLLLDHLLFRMSR